MYEVDLLPRYSALAPIEQADIVLTGRVLNTIFEGNRTCWTHLQILHLFRGEDLASQALMNDITSARVIIYENTDHPHLKDRGDDNA